MRLLLAILAPAVLFAQNATLSGLVKDSAQAPIPEATLVVSQVETGTERTVKSNTAGAYVLPALTPGHYKITVDAPGFQVKTLENVELTATQNARLDLTLEGSAGEIRGSVADAHSGETLANIQIRLAGTPYRIVSDGDGRFHVGAIPPGDYVLNVFTVGYHMEKHALHLDAGETKEISVVLTPDTLRQTETVNAVSDPFDTARGDSPDVLTLAGNDAKNLGSVLADDPLRAVQGLPGVTSNKDFEARFSLRGADYSRIGLYLDGVLLHDPFNMLQTRNDVGTVTAFNADLVEEMDLYKAAFPVRFEDRDAGVLDVDTRDGSRDSYLFRASASSSAASFMAEGPLGRRSKKAKPRGSWLVAVRKSYLQYLLDRALSNAPEAFDMEDVQARISYDLTPSSVVNLSILESYTNEGQSGKANLGSNSLLKGGYHYTLGNLGWRYSPSSKLLITNHAAWMREKYNDTAPGPLPLAGGYYGEWVDNLSATWLWSSHAPFDAGFSVRRVRDQDFSNQYESASGIPSVLDHADGTALRLGGYVQQSWQAWNGRLRLTAGGRWDRDSIDRVSTFSPQASLSLGVTKSTHVQLGWGEYSQYPEISVFLSPFGNRGLLPERSIHAVAAIEQRFGSRTRLRAEVYDRADRDIPFQPFYDPRILNGVIFNPPPDPLYYNSLRGHSRGAEVFLQRSSANRFTGWISYAYGKTMMRDGISGQSFPSDYDQRNTVNVYGGFRVRPTINLSLRSSYGSGFPIPGDLAVNSHGYYVLAADRNQLRLKPYQRTDFRVNKSWSRDKWKYTLYAEVINLTNHANDYFLSFNNYDSQTGQVSITVNKTFPILPFAGMMVEW